MEKETLIKKHILLNRIATYAGVAFVIFSFTTLPFVQMVNNFEYIYISFFYLLLGVIFSSLNYSNKLAKKIWGEDYTRLNSEYHKWVKKNKM